MFSNGFTSVGDFFVHLLYLSGWFLILFHLTSVKFLSSNLSANIFVFGDFHFTQMVNFFAWMPDSGSHIPALLDFFLF